jgi:hypothetical protein
VKRKGAGRKKGQITKAKERDLSPGEITALAFKGDQKEGAIRVYQHLRTLARKLDGCSRREAYSAVEGWMLEAKKSPEIFEALFVLVNAMHRKNVAFFNDLARTVALMVRNDAAPDTISAPPADLEFYWLGRLREYYDAESNVFCPPFFSESANEVLSMPRKSRPPLTIKMIGDFLKLHIGYRPSESSISAKAKIVGLPLHGKFGHKRQTNS